jgi:para-nitrobenzyl esterase
MDNPGLVPITDHPDAHALAAQMSGAWIAFARHGDPNHPDLPAWEPYSLDRRATMLFDAPSRVDDDPFATERLAWVAP